MPEFTLTDLRRTVDGCLGARDAAELTDQALDERFDELGLDSLAVYEIVTMLQDELAIPISDEAIDAMITPRAVLDFVNERLEDAARTSGFHSNAPDTAAST